jgi:nucleoid-associated protein YgaU
MKSSTIGRSMLSKESMDVIENLSNDQYIYNDNEEEVIQNSDVEDAPGEYLRAESEEDRNKSKEIDLLWQTFKPSQFNTNSPVVYIIEGFLLGVIATLAVMLLLGGFGIKPKFSAFHKTPAAAEVQERVDLPADTVVEGTIAASETNEEPVQEQEPVANKNSEQSSNSEVSEPVTMKKYVIKDGDTVEAIIKRYYGAYTPERAQSIMKANNLSNLDRISIGQVLLLPIEK